MGTLLEPQALNREQRLVERIKTLETRISNLERSPLAFPQIAGAPTSAPIDGSGAVDTTLKIWVRINGVWRFVPVT